jgi:hypothetical protein
MNSNSVRNVVWLIAFFVVIALAMLFAPVTGDPLVFCRCVIGR